MPLRNKHPRSIPVRLEESVYADLKAIAKKNHLSIEELVRIAVVQQLARDHSGAMQVGISQAGAPSFNERISATSPAPKK